MFSVGQRVKALPIANAHYQITTQEAEELEVVEVLNNVGQIRVLLISHKAREGQAFVGRVFSVEQRHFVPLILDNRRLNNV